MKIGGFQKCKLHASSLKGLEITACQSWCKFALAGIRTRDLTKIMFNLVSVRSLVQILAGANLHQLWQAVILKPFKLEECILHFWKPPIFINLVLAVQDHTYSPAKKYLYNLLCMK